ncbi:MAG: hypothetical protein N2595_08260 [bacterium]|nr:hypothetical protein [bacterium]
MCVRLGGVSGRDSGRLGRRPATPVGGVNFALACFRVQGRQGGLYASKEDISHVWLKERRVHIIISRNADGDALLSYNFRPDPGQNCSLNQA